MAASWWRRRARWKRVIVAVVVTYALAVLVNLVIRLWLRDWQWHADVLSSALIMGLMLPSAVVAEQLWALRRRSSGDGR